MDLQTQVESLVSQFTLEDAKEVATEYILAMTDKALAKKISSLVDKPVSRDFAAQLKLVIELAKDEHII